MKQKLRKVCFEKTQVKMFKSNKLYETFNFKTPFKLYKAVESYLEGKEYQIGGNEIFLNDDTTLYLGVLKYDISLFYL